MSVHQINFKPLLLPENSGYVLNQVYSYTADVGTTVFRQEVKFAVEGDYRLEYWSVDNAGNVEDHNIINFHVYEYKQPIPIGGGCFDNTIDSLSEFINLLKDGVKLHFSRNRVGLGEDLDWRDLDVKGVHIKRQIVSGVEECAIEVVPGSWLSKRLNNERKIVPITVENGRRIFVKIGRDEFLLATNNGMIPNLPRHLRGYIEKPLFEDNKLTFLLRQAGSFTVKCS